MENQNGEGIFMVGNNTAESCTPHFVKKTVPVVVGGEWSLSSPLGHGSFGQVFLARNTHSPSNVIAVKLEMKKPGRSRKEIPYVIREAEILSVLQGFQGFPELVGAWEINKEWFGLGMSLLGPSLAELTRWVGGTGLGWPTLIAIGSQVLFCLERLHSFSFLHRDVKPHNLLMGLSPTSRTVYLVDFGLSKSYVSTKNKMKHIPQQRKNGVVGTAKFASVFIHEGSESSMRDDLESLAYSLIWLGTGNLPWDYVDSRPYLEKKMRNAVIHAMKQGTPIDKLCQGLPVCIKELLTYVRSLEFGAAPDYCYLQNLFHADSAALWSLPPHALPLHWHDPCPIPPPVWNQPVYTFSN